MKKIFKNETILLYGELYKVCALNSGSKCSSRNKAKMSFPGWMGHSTKIYALLRKKTKNFNKPLQLFFARILVIYIGKKIF